MLLMASVNFRRATPDFLGLSEHEPMNIGSPGHKRSTLLSLIGTEMKAESDGKTVTLRVAIDESNRQGLVEVEKSVEKPKETGGMSVPLAAPLPFEWISNFYEVCNTS